MRLLRIISSKSARCPLYPQKRTLPNTVVVSALCQERTSAARSLCQSSPAAKRSWLRMKRRWPTIFGCDPPRLTPAWRYLPHRKRSADIVGRCAEYTEGEAAANKAEQHGRFHAIDLLPVDVRLVGEVGHGSSPCNTLPALSPSNYLAICIGGCDRGNTKSQSARRTRAHPRFSRTNDAAPLA